MDYSNSSNACSIYVPTFLYYYVEYSYKKKKPGPLLNYRVTVLNYVCNIGVYTIYYSIGSTKMIRNAN